MSAQDRRLHLGLACDPGSATTKAIEYSLGRWAALTRYLDDGQRPIDNNWGEDRIRPVALGCSNLRDR